MRTARWILGGMVVLGAITAASCGEAQDPVEASVAVVDPAEPTPEPTPTPTPAQEPTDEQSSPVSPATPGLAAGAFALCDDLPEAAATKVGHLPDRANPDPEVQNAIGKYAEANTDVWGGLFLDRDHGGTMVILVTDEPARHVEALGQLIPAEAPVSTDAGPGSVQAVVWEVQQVTRSHADLLDRTTSLMQLRPRLPVISSGPDTLRNRVRLSLLDPTEETYERLLREADPAAICLSVAITPPRPDGPLQVIGDPTVPGPRDLPPGVSQVQVSLGGERNPDSTEVLLSVIERDCASGQEMGDRLLGPEVVETEDAVYVAFGVVVNMIVQTCPAHGPTEVRIELFDPLGDREIRDAVKDIAVSSR